MQIRREEPGEQRASETLTREAFWNLYVPGANEHFILHQVRKRPEFIADLCLVAESEGELVGHIVYYRVRVEDVDGTSHECISFGPVSVHPEHQGKGIGAALIKASIERAKELGFQAIVILGSPGYYERFGFGNGALYGIHMPGGFVPKGLQVLPLSEEGIEQIKGTLFLSGVFDVDEDGCKAFDDTFPAKDMFETASQKAFACIVSLSHEDEVPEHLYQMLTCTLPLEKSAFRELAEQLAVD